VKQSGPAAVIPDSPGVPETFGHAEEESSVLMFHVKHRLGCCPNLGMFHVKQLVLDGLEKT
jgi:hypothetical protein